MREEIEVEFIEEIRVEIKDGEFGDLIKEEVGEKQPAEDPQKQANVLKATCKGNHGQTSDNSKDDRKQSETNAKQYIGNITENGSRYSQLQEMQFKCKQCEKGFIIKRELLRHTKIVHEGKTRMFKIR